MISDKLKLDGDIDLDYTHISMLRKIHYDSFRDKKASENGFHYDAKQIYSFTGLR